MSKAANFILPQYATPWGNGIVFSAAVVSATLLVASVITMVRAGDTKPKPSWATYVLLFWTVVPPVWFWAEFHFIWKTAPTSGSTSLEVFRYGQEVSRNIWIAMTAVVAALYFNRPRHA
jgi:hypothetical protein